MSDADLDGPEWIHPAADYHRDLTALTAAVRGAVLDTPAGASALEATFTAAFGQP